MASQTHVSDIQFPSDKTHENNQNSSVSSATDVELCEKVSSTIQYNNQCSNAVNNSDAICEHNDAERVSG